MELSQYWGIVTRWFWLILAGTLIAIAIGAAVEFKSKLGGSATSYQAQATVDIKCTSPCGTYLPGVNVSSAYNQILPHAQDPQATEIGRLPLACTSVSAFMDPVTQLADVQTVASTKRSAILCANTVAHYLAGIQLGAVAALADQAVRTYQGLAQQARATWLGYVHRLAELNGYHPTKRAVLNAKEGLWLSLYESYSSTITTLQYPVVPAVVVTPASKATKYQPKPLSPIKTIIPAAIIGLILSFLLAALFDSRRTLAQVTRSTGAAPSTPPRSSGHTAEPVMATPIAGVSSNPRQSEAPVQPVESVDPVVAETTEPPSILATLAEPMRRSASAIAGLVEESKPSLLVTSPTTDEPKSETAVGLAVALAETGLRVALVDADPSGAISRYFGVSSDPGLTDFLGGGRSSAQELMQPIQYESAGGSLFILPQGMRQLDVSPFAFASERGMAMDSWRKVFAQLAADGYLAVLDGPTVLENPGLMDSAGQSGGVIVALEKERSGPDVTQTYDILRARGARLLGVVANPVTVRLSSSRSRASDSNPFSMASGERQA